MSGAQVDILQGSLAEIGAAFRARRLSIAEAVEISEAHRGAGQRWPETQCGARGEPQGHRGCAPPRCRTCGSARPRAVARHRYPVEGQYPDRRRNDGNGGVAALAGFVPKHEATLVQRLRAAGAVILGKANLTEFADFVSDVMPSEFSGAGGVVRNPHGIRTIAARAPALAPPPPWRPACVPSLLAARPRIRYRRRPALARWLATSRRLAW